MKINRRQFIGSLASGATLAVSQTTAREYRQRGKSPNLLFVLCDQMRGQALGFLDLEPVITPVLDNFSTESATLTQAASNYPVCSPYRAMLMTGKWPAGNKVWDNCNSNSEPYGCELQAQDRCWSDVLKEKGYSLGYIGKWHLDAPRSPYIDCSNNRGSVKWNEWCTPDRRHGFDFWHSYGTYDYHMRPMYWSTSAKREDFRYVNQWGPEHETDLTIKYLRNENGKYRVKDNPFALVVSMNPPHMPYAAHPPEYLKPYKDIPDSEIINKPSILGADTKMGRYYRKNIRHYYAMISGVDKQFGRILKTVDELGLREETIVVFTSDHGNCLGIHNSISKNVAWEESMRVPFMIRHPGRIKTGHNDLMLSTPDIYPTLLDLMGFKNDIPGTVQGVSHAEALTTGGGVRPTSQLYIWSPPDSPETGRRGVRTQRHTLVVQTFKNKPPERRLYDNIKDPYQMENIATRESRLFTRLYKEELMPWLRKSNDPWIGINLDSI